MATPVQALGTEISQGGVPYSVATANSVQGYNPVTGVPYASTPVTTPTPALPGPDASASVIPGVNDPATLQGYTQSINDIDQTIGSLPTQQEGTDAQIVAAYNTAYQQLLGNLNSANSAYSTNTTGNQQNFVGNKNTINASSGSSLNGLERLLASRGAGGSSAATIVAPTAVAQQTTGQLAGAAGAYGSTQSGLDQSIGAYREQNQNDQNSISQQEQQNTTNAAATVANTKAGLLQQLATLSAQDAAAQGNNPTTAAAPYLAQAQSALSAANNLGLQVAPLNYNTAAYAAPTAASYTPNTFSTPTTANPTPNILSNTVSNAAAPLLKATTALSGVPNTAAPATSPAAGA